MARQFTHAPNQRLADNVEEHADTKTDVLDDKDTCIEGTLYEHFYQRVSLQASKVIVKYRLLVNHNI
jgi:hypothetical protein